MSTLTGVQHIERERARQQVIIGVSSSHDDEHDGGEIAYAAMAYAQAAIGGTKTAEQFWPWEPDTFKPSMGRDRVRDLAKAGALIAAEIDRLQRAERAGDSQGTHP